MAKVLQNFLIGVGLDTEQYDKGAKGVESSLSRMRTLVGFTGAAITGAFGLAGTAAINAGRRVHDFNVTAEKLKTPTEYVHNYGRALAALGGNAEEALAAISAIEKAQSDLRLAGMLGPLENVALARGDINALAQTQDGAEFLRTLAGMIPQMDKDQRRMVQDALGLSDVVMISLQNGVEAFDAGIARAGELYGEFGRATDAAREYARAVAEINTRFQGIGETLAEKMLPGFTGIIDSVGGIIDKNRDLISKGASVLGENPGATALAAGGGAAAATGAGLRMIGLRGAGMAVSRLGMPGMVIGGGLIAVDAAKDWEWGDWWQQSKDSVRDSWRRLTGQDDVSHLPDAPYGSSVPDVAPGSVIPREPLPINPAAHGLVDAPWAPNPNYPAQGLVEYMPVYAGGEISNAEAASANPEVITIRDLRQQAEKPVTTPRVSVDNNLNIQLEMDGRAIDTRVIDVIERRERDTMDDIYSSVDR